MRKHEMDPGSEILTAAGMRAVEARAIAEGGVTGSSLMERAGTAFVAAVVARWPDLGVGEHRAVVLCGPGNNGGDGFVVARLLAARGWGVEVLLCGDPDRLPADAAANREAWRGRVRPLSPDAAEQADRLRHALEEREGRPVRLVVDAIFGTGLTRPVEGLTGVLAVNRDRGVPGPVWAAVDVPTGLCADSGRSFEAVDAPQDALCADLTVAFHRAKPGHYLGCGPEVCGALTVVDIGLDRAERAIDEGPPLTLTGVRDPRRTLGKAGGGHKYAFGHAVVLSGGVGRGGAARMAARGALRIGAGLVTVLCPPAALIENAARLDAVMLRPVRDAPALAEVLGDARIRSVCIGPGLGVARAAALLPAVLEARREALAVVLDADALTAVARDGDLMQALSPTCILTPHDGEFARLFPDLAARLREVPSRGPLYSRIHAAREAAARAGCTVLLKGPATVIADPEGRVAINAAVYDRAAPWLATAGAGDVLAGFIAGLSAHGLAPFDAACTAAWLHVGCALAFGPGLIAEDLPDALPGVLRSLGL